jgi:nucleoside-diphosphate-sugar epimerase
MKKILITGINGYLGSKLAKTLAPWYEILGLEYSTDNLFRIKDENYKVYSVANGIPGELFSSQNIDIVIHAATFYGRDKEDINTMANANLFIPFGLLNQAINNNCQLFINTDTVLDRFVSVYALTKRHFQEWLYMRRKQIKVINMQLEHFYGPGCSNTNFITAMVERLKRNDSPIDLTSGEQLRNFIYIDDVVRAFVTVIEKADEIREDYSHFQVGTSNLVSIKETVEMLKKITQSTSQLNFGVIPYRENELMKSEVDNSALVKLGWEPKFSLNTGLELTSE